MGNIGGQLDLVILEVFSISMILKGCFSKETCTPHPNGVGQPESGDTPSVGIS